LFQLAFEQDAVDQLSELRRDKGQAVRLKAVQSALGKLEKNPRSPGLNTHPFKGKFCPHGDTIWESYAQNHTPGAFRIFWCYMPLPHKRTILILSITEHP